jgi:ABC-type multidrug transport system ATPase subunit
MAVDRLDLTLGTGVHGLLGPNGAGKTTLVRALATVLRPAGGTLTLLGERVTGRLDLTGLRGVRRQIGYLPQEFGFYRRFRVREFVEYLAWLKEMPAAEVPGAVQRAIERVGLTDRADHKMKTLSGGMRRRVGIAQAIVNDPQILLLDEPTAGLDPDQRLQFRALLRDLAADTCVLVATHLVEDVAAACTDVMLMDEGRLVFQGTPADLAAAAGDGDGEGDSQAERGYSQIMRRRREGLA